MLSAGLLDLLDELTAGTLIMPRGLSLNPTEAAVAWAEGEAEQVPVEAWPVLGIPGASADTSLVSQPKLLVYLALTQLEATVTRAVIRVASISCVELGSQ